MEAFLGSRSGTLHCPLLAAEGIYVPLKSPGDSGTSTPAKPCESAMNLLIDEKKANEDAESDDADKRTTADIGDRAVSQRISPNSTSSGGTAGAGGDRCTGGGGKSTLF